MAQIVRYCPICKNTFRQFDPDLSRDTPLTAACFNHILETRQFMKIKNANGAVLAEAHSDDGGKSFVDKNGNPLVINK